MKSPGITALAHPLNVSTATRHGVFVFENTDEIRRKYKEGDMLIPRLVYGVHLDSLMVHFLSTLDPNSPSTMSEVKRFLHKVSVEKMKANNAIISETSKVISNHFNHHFC